MGAVGPKALLGPQPPAQGQPAHDECFKDAAGIYSLSLQFWGLWATWHVMNLSEPHLKKDTRASTKQNWWVKDYGLNKGISFLSLHKPSPQI